MFSVMHAGGEGGVLNCCVSFGHLIGEPLRPRGAPVCRASKPCSQPDHSHVVYPPHAIYLPAHTLVCLSHNPLGYIKKQKTQHPGRSNLRS